MKKGYRPGSWVALPIVVVVTFLAFLIYARLIQDKGISQAEIDANRARTSTPAR